MNSSHFNRIITICFLIVFCVANLNAQNLMTIGEVFDFNIDDEFHSKVDVAPPMATRLRVIDKHFSENNDTVYYSFYDFSYHTDVESDNTLTYHFDEDTIDIFYTYLDSSLVYYDNNFMYDTSFGVNTCGIETNGYTVYDSDFEPSIDTKRYARGLGLIERSAFEGHGANWSWSESMFYYSKGDEICGTPDLLTRINSINAYYSEALVYPNPASNHINIKNNIDEIKAVCILDLKGNIIKNIPEHNNNSEIDIYGLSAGIYLLEIIYKSRIETIKLIKL